METAISQEPLVSIKGKKIRQIGIIVEKAEETAIEMAALFGIGPWMIMDVMPTEIVLHDRYLGAVPSIQRVALSDWGDLQVELIQPLSGVGTHAEFQQKYGQGIHHMSFGMLEDYDAFLAGMKKAGFGIDMQGILAGFLSFTYMSTQEDLGTIVEFTRRIPPVPKGKQSGTNFLRKYTPEGSASLNMKGKKIVKLGIVVRDVEKSAKKYWQVFGVGPWTLADMQAPKIVLHDRTHDQSPFSVRSGTASIGDLQIELLQPLSGQSSYAEFLGKYGNGIHHLSFGYVEDADEMVATVQKQGYGIEMQGILGGNTEVTYLSTQQKLGAIYGLAKKIPGAKNTLAGC